MSVLANAPTLYCAVPYVVACVDVSGTVFEDGSKPQYQSVSHSDYNTSIHVSVQELISTSTLVCMNKNLKSQ